MNNVILMGNLCGDPAMKVSASGTSMATFTLAVRRNRKNKQGEYESDFLRCIAFSYTADFISKYLTKGSKVLVAGSIQTGSYDKSDGTKVFTTDIVVSEVEFAGSRRDAETTAPQQTNNSGDNFKQMGFEEVSADDQLPF